MGSARLTTLLLDLHRVGADAQPEPGPAPETALEPEPEPLPGAAAAAASAGGDRREEWLKSRAVAFDVLDCEDVAQASAKCQALIRGVQIASNGVHLRQLVLGMQRDALDRCALTQLARGEVSRFTRKTM